MGPGKSYLQLKSCNLLNISLQLWILMVWTNLLTMGKPVEENLSPKDLSKTSASRRFGPQFWGQSEKHIQLCEHVCSNDPIEGQKYCNCSPEPSMVTNNEDFENKPQLIQQQQQPQQQQKQQQQDQHQQSAYQYQQLQPQVDQHSSSQHQQQTIQMPEVNYLGAHEAAQMCDILCSENPNEAIKYCNCPNHNNLIADNNNINIDNPVVNNNNFNSPPVNQVMSSSEQITSEPHPQPQLTLADYLRLDPSAEKQLCSYLCSGNSLKLDNNQYCNCKTKKVNQQTDKMMGPTQGNNQHSTKSQLISELGKPNLSSNPVAIKNILDAAVDSNHRKELCSYVCALEPNEAANNQCNCNQNINNPKESGKSPRTRFHLNPWRSIKKWFG